VSGRPPARKPASHLEGSGAAGTSPSTYATSHTTRSWPQPHRPSPEVRHRLLGNSGLRVSELLLGRRPSPTAFAHAAGVDEARRIVDALADAGGNMIDTPSNYRDGASEEIVGEVLDGRRDRCGGHQRRGACPCRRTRHARRDLIGVGERATPDAATTDVSTHIKQITGLATAFRKHQSGRSDETGSAASSTNTRRSHGVTEFSAPTTCIMFGSSMPRHGVDVECKRSAFTDIPI
jgi:hypothetical protein